MCIRNKQTIYLQTDKIVYSKQTDNLFNSRNKDECDTKFDLVRLSLNYDKQLENV